PGATPAGFPATVGTDISFSGGRVGRIVEVRRGAAVVASGERMLTVDFGTDVRCDGRRAHLVAPPERVGTNTAALTAWRSARAKAENKPAYVFLSNQHLEGIAQRDPDTLERLARCSGVGPTRLDAYGEELLAVLAGPESER
ncbi:MAG: HRDC domain-containing protein, partial [Acidimicrobiia bacterium]